MAKTREGGAETDPVSVSAARADAGEMAPVRGPSGGRRVADEPVAVQPTQEQLAMAMAFAQVQMQTQRQALAPTPNMDRTVPGGAYIVDGVLVNAHGHAIPDKAMPKAAKKDVDAWLDREAEARQGEFVMVERPEEEADDEANLTAEQKRIRATNEARSAAADELRKRAEQIADQASKKKE